MRSLDLPNIKKQVATLELAEGFFDSIVLFALYELGTFRCLAERSKDLEELREETGANRDTLEAVLDAAVALRILSKEGGRYRARDDLLDCLGREGSPAYMGEWISFLHALAAPLLKLGEAARTGDVPGALFDDMSGDSLPAKRMTPALDAYARTRGIELAERFDFRTTRRLLDLGCGPGTYSIAILDSNPHVHATLLDLPGPIAEARRIVAERGMTARVRFVTRDAMEYVPEEPFDTLLISNILHMLGPERSRALLARCHDLLLPGGRILVQAQYLNDDRTSPRWPTLLNLIQRAATPHGRNHTVGETRAWLEEAGFEDVQFVPLSLWNVNRCLVARRSETKAGGLG